MTEQECAVRLFLTFGDAAVNFRDMADVISRNNSVLFISQIEPLIKYEWIVRSNVAGKAYRVNTDKIKEILNEAE